MKCPNCNVDLVMTERQGVEIDYCPKCRGIWLDRGELDKIIEKSLVGEKPVNTANKESQNPFRNNNDHYDDDHGHGGYSNGRKKKNMLGDLFDF